MIGHPLAEPLNRRQLLRGTAVAGAAALAAGRAVAAGPAAVETTGLRLFAEEDLNFQASFVLGGSAYGAGEIGEVATAVDAINAAGASYQTFYDTFMALGAKLAAEARDAERLGRAITARAKHLRSAAYFNQALFFVLGSATPAAEASVYRAMQDEWNAYTVLDEGRYERVEIPYRDGIALPAYFVRPSNDGRRRKTVIINNGSDAQFVDVYAYGVAAALDRGYNALIFEGPGQGSLLFERRICFTPDWAGVITPIVDYLVGRGDVDAKRIALTGWSMGGNLVIRAASREHRIAAIVSDPGALSLIASYLARGGDQIFGADVADPNAIWQGYIKSPAFTEAQKFLFAKRTEIYAPSLLADARAGKTFTDVKSFIDLVDAFTIPPDMAAAVTAHVLVTDYQLDQFFPGQPEEMLKLLTSAASTKAASLHDRRRRRVPLCAARASGPQRGRLRLAGLRARPAGSTIALVALIAVRGAITPRPVVARPPHPRP